MTFLIILLIFYLITGIDPADLYFLIPISVFFLMCIFLSYSIYYGFFIFEGKKAPTWKIVISIFIMIILFIGLYLQAIHEPLMWKLTPEKEKFIGGWENYISGDIWTFKNNGTLYITNDYSTIENSEILNISIQDRRDIYNYSLKDSNLYFDNQIYTYIFENNGESLRIYNSDDSLFVHIYKI